MAMKKLQGYGTSKGERYLATSLEAFAKWWNNQAVEGEMAAFAGTILIKTENLERVAPGVYRERTQS